MSGSKTFIEFVDFSNELQFSVDNADKQTLGILPIFDTAGKFNIKLYMFVQRFNLRLAAEQNLIDLDNFKITIHIAFRLQHMTNNDFRAFRKFSTENLHNAK